MLISIEKRYAVMDIARHAHYAQDEWMPVTECLMWIRKASFFFSFMETAAFRICRAFADDFCRDILLFFAAFFIIAVFNVFHRFIGLFSDALPVFIDFFKQFFFILLLDHLDLFFHQLSFICVCLLMCAVSKYGRAVYESIGYGLFKDLLKDLFKNGRILIASDIVLWPGRKIRDLFLNIQTKKPAIGKVDCNFLTCLAHGIDAKDDIDDQHFKKNHRIYARSSVKTVKVIDFRINKTKVKRALQLTDQVILWYKFIQSKHDDAIEFCVVSVCHCHNVTLRKPSIIITFQAIKKAEKATNLGLRSTFLP